MQDETTPAELLLKQQKAERTLDWRSVDKVSFLWGEQPVIGYYDRERHNLHIINSVDEQTCEEIYGWLGKILPDTLEDTDENE